MEKSERKTMDIEDVQAALIHRIHECCEERGITYYNLSYMSAIPLSTLAHLMNGVTENPGIFTILRICEGFGITLQEFFDTRTFDELAGGRYDQV